MDLFSLGLYLRDTREAKEIALEKAEIDLRIRRRILESFEQGEFNITDASSVQIRGFLRNYARYLGLDDDRIVLLYEAALQNANRRGRGRSRPAKPPSEKRKPEKPITESRRVVTQEQPATERRWGGKRRTRQERRELREKRASQELNPQELSAPASTNPMMTPTEFPVFTDRPASRPRREITDTDPALPRVTYGEKSDNRRSLNFLNTLAILVIALAAIGVIIFVGVQLIQPPQDNQPEGILGQLPDQPTFSLVPTLGFAPTPGPTLPVDTLGIAQQYDGEGVAVTIRAQQRTWLRVTTDGNEQINRLVLPEEILDYRSPSIITVTASNAEALVMIYNGQPQGIFGGRGQAVDLTFTPTETSITTGPGFEPTLEISSTPPPTQDQGLPATLLAQQTPTATPGPSPTASNTPTITNTALPTATPSASPTITFTPLPTNTAGPTPTASDTPQPSNTPPPTAPVPPRIPALSPTPSKEGA